MDLTITIKIPLAANPSPRIIQAAIENSAKAAAAAVDAENHQAGRTVTVTGQLTAAQTFTMP